MSNEPLTTMQKAFNLNMDLAKYGTIAEIGAGQEVSRFFLEPGVPPEPSQKPFPPTIWTSVMPSTAKRRTIGMSRRAG